MDLKKVVDEMKGKGVETAMLKRDGGLVYSTFAMEDPAPSVAQYLANNAEMLMQELGDSAKEVELSFEGKSLLLVPMGKYIFVGLIKGKEDEKTLRSYLDSIRAMF